MSTARQAHKRRRSAIACVNCHDRKVRCNAAFQGIPCSNCLQDRVACEVYGRKPSVISSRRPIRPRLPDDAGEAANLLTPSTQGFETLSEEAGSSLRSHDGTSPIVAENTTPQEQPADPAVAAHQRDEPVVQLGLAGKDVVPFYAGESEGLEFIFEICAPTRALKGTHYIVNRQVHKREHLRAKVVHKPVPFPDLLLRQELLRSYFHYVHPFLPLIDIHSFFQKYTRGVDQVSPLLLWSMFFASANFLKTEVLRQNRFSSRKSFKDFCYHRARDEYDAQDEPDKIAVIQSAILLAIWYVDLEDRDGTWHWMGIAISLCHTIGLHRESNFDQVPRTPFPPRQRAIWKRIWWCCYYREAFAALGFGRPLRINIDDCDVTVPIVSEVVQDIQNVPDSILETYLPTDRERLANQWIHLLHLAMHVEHMIAMHYRPRRQLLSLSQLEAEGADLWKLQDSAPLGTDSLPATTVLHAHHLHCYFNTAVIALYRPYSLSTPAHLTPAQREQLRSVAQQRIKDAAGSTTAVINKLVALDMIELSLNMIVTTSMFAAQVHLLEIKQSEGLARQFASHNFNLHVLVLSQLRRTYWTADHQHKLFTETLKAIEEGERQTQQELRASGGASVSNNPTLITATVQPDQSYANEEEENLDCEGFGGSGRALEDIFLSFNPNPFISLPTDFDPGTPEDWVLGTNTPLNLEGSH